jgi:hypothetical protein
VAELVLVSRLQPPRILPGLIVALLLLTLASSVKPADKNSLRYDGVHQTQTLTGQDAFLYLRFYSDGHVVAMASVWTPEKVASFISRSQPELPQGDYRLEGSKVLFTTKGPRVRLITKGMINENGILFHIHSGVTDFAGDQQFVFRTVGFPTTPEPLTNG